MKKSPFIFLAQLSAVALIAGVCVASASGQGRGGSGGFNTGSGGFNTGSGGFNTGNAGGTGGSNSGGNSSSLFNSGSGGSSSLFNSGSSSSGGTGSGSGSGGSGSGSGSSGGSGGVSSNLQTEIQTGQIGAATPITRGAAIERNSSGAYLINSNPDTIGGQPSAGGNQFANLFSQIGRQMNQGGNFNQQGGRNAVRPAIRIPLRLGFTPKPISVPQFTARFESRMAKLPGITSIGPIRVTMDGSTAVLTGVVASEQDRELAAGLAMLEPEVGSVRNELTVQNAEPGAEGLNSPSNVP
jgi:hypothetical protein